MGTPIYKEIIEQLKEMIQKEPFINGEIPIPNELKLCDIYGVSRETIRKSISFLVQDGYLYRQRKNGTFVNTGKLKNKTQLISWSTYHTEKEKMGKEVSVYYKKISVMPIHKIRAIEFHADPLSNIIELERVLGTTSPEAYFKSYFNPNMDIFYTKKFQNFEWNSLYDFIEKNGITLFRSEESISARRITTEIAEMLEIDDTTTPIIKRERRVYDINNNLIEINIGYYNGDKTKYDLLITK